MRTQALDKVLLGGRFNRIRVSRCLHGPDGPLAGPQPSLQAPRKRPSWPFRCSLPGFGAALPGCLSQRSLPKAGNHDRK